MIRSVFAAVGIVLVTTVASAQSRPNFAGTWNLTASFPANSSPPTRLVLAQDDSAIEIDNQRYALNGSQASALRPERTWRAEWDTSALTITTRTDGPRSSWEDRDIYSLDPRGNLVVVRMRTSLVPGSMSTNVAIYQREARRG